VFPPKHLAALPDRRDVVRDRPVAAQDDDSPKPATPHRLVDIEQQVVEGLWAHPEHIAGHVVAFPALDATGQVAAVRQVLAPVSRPAERRHDEPARPLGRADAHSVRL